MEKCSRCGANEYPDDGSLRYTNPMELLERSDWKQTGVTDAWQLIVAGSRSGTLGLLWDMMILKKKAESPN